MIYMDTTIAKTRRNRESSGERQESEFVTYLRKRAKSARDLSVKQVHRCLQDADAKVMFLAVYWATVDGAIEWVIKTLPKKFR